MQNQNVIVTNNAEVNLGSPSNDQSIFRDNIKSTNRKSIYLNGRRMHPVSLVEAEVLEHSTGILGSAEQWETGYSLPVLGAPPTSVA